MLQKPVIIILVGVSGDLSKRYLLPALTQLSHAEVLPKHLRIIGVTRRTDVTVTPLLENVEDKTFLEKHLEIYTMDLDDKNAYTKLADHILQIETEFGAESERIFYLSVPPQVAKPIIEFLGKTGLNNTSNAKLMVEKPFGTDLASAEDLITHIDSFFEPDQVYRIDHYMAKEMAQNIAVFRGSTSIFKHSWNNTFISSIDIVAIESIGIEGRATFYEQTGALRDLIQSHLMALAALTIMEVPTRSQREEIPARRLDALKSLRVSSATPILTAAKRGQYQGYADQAENPDSEVETFASVTLESNDPRWSGVPITLTTGKALSERLTEIRITYRRDENDETNALVIGVQPKEAITLQVMCKTPGYTSEVKPQPMTLSYRDHFSESPKAYERVFLDAIKSDHHLFTTAPEVLETWRILAPVQEAWASAGKDGLVIYPPGASIDAITGSDTFQ